MPADLPQCERVTLEQVSYTGPVVKETPDPGEADQANAELDAARPVDARQEGILLPPGAQLVGHPARVLLFVGKKPGIGQQREVLQPGDLPDLLDVADLLLRAVIDTEGITVRSGPATCHRVAKPVGAHQIGPNTPSTSHSPRISRSALSRTAALASSGTRSAVPGGKTAANLRSPAGRRRVRAESARTHLPSRPSLAAPDRARATPPRQATCGGLRAYQPAVSPDRAHTRSGFPLDRLSPTAMVALVTATRASTGIGIGAPARTASTNCPSSARWPLS